MIELYVVKATRTVPRQERGGTPDLADKHTSVVLRGERSQRLHTYSALNFIKVLALEMLNSIHGQPQKREKHYNI